MPGARSQIFKPCADVTQEESVAALKKALAEEAGAAVADSHEHGHLEPKAQKTDGEPCGDGCCGHDHDEGAEHGHKEEHEHGHGHEAEHGHKEEHGHEHDGCCGHDKKEEHGHGHQEEHGHGHKE